MWVFCLDVWIKECADSFHVFVVHHVLYDYIMCVPDACRGQKTVLELLCAGNWTQFSGRVASALNCWTMSPALKNLCFKIALLRYIYHFECIVQGQLLPQFSFRKCLYLQKIPPSRFAVSLQPVLGNEAYLVWLYLYGSMYWCFLSTWIGFQYK